MNSKNIFPWIIAVAALVAIGFLFSGGKAKEAELTRLRAENAELPELRNVAATAQKTAQNAAEPINEKERVELLRLRNEVGQLRRDKQQLTAQIKQIQQNQEQLMTQQQAQKEQLQQQNQILAQQSAKSSTDEAKNACINNLRQIDGAKQQWALENKQPADAFVVPQQIVAYLRNSTLPTCPSGGTYTLNDMSHNPTCSTPGHALTP